MSRKNVCIFLYTKYAIIKISRRNTDYVDTFARLRYNITVILIKVLPRLKMMRKLIFKNYYIVVASCEGRVIFYLNIMDCIKINVIDIKSK